MYGKLIVENIVDYYKFWCLKYHYNTNIITTDKTVLIEYIKNIT